MTAREPRVVIEDGDDELEGVLRALRRILLQYPAASQAIFQAFVREGRSFASTDEGRRCQEHLARSELIRRARAVWEVGTLNVLEEDETAVLPSKMLDAFVQLCGVDGLDAFLARLYEKDVGVLR